jgi:arylsulfatase A-like enzyme
VHGDFARAEDAGRLPRIVSGKEVEEMHGGRLVPTPAEKRYVTDLYDGDVAHADRIVGGFFEALRKDGSLDRVLVVVLSDHGEELWDREPGYSPDHGHSLYQELVHVPLLVRWPGQVPSGARIRTPVSLLDVAPTLLELARLPADPVHQGRSLATTLRTGSEPEARTIQVESVQYGPDRFLMRNGDLAAILTPYPDRLDNSVPIPALALEVFDLAADPLEQHDLSAHLSEAAAEMVDALWQRSRGVLNPPSRKGQEQPPELPEELLEQLRSLGYLR